MKRLAFVSALALVGAVQLYAQDPVPSASPVYQAPVQTGTKAPPKQIVGGVLNGKAISLPKPPYPPAARAVNASGTVNVQVLIDEEGNVIGATALSGHPLLRAAAVEAAKQAKFSPTQLQGSPVKVSGVIVYNFVGALYPAKLAFVLGHAERTGMFGKYGSAESLAYQLPKEWVEEREVLNGLTFEETVVPDTVRRADPSKSGEVQTDKAAEPKKEERPDIKRILDANKAEPPTKDTNRYTIAGSAVTYPAPYYSDRKLDARSASAVRGLLDTILDRTEPNSLPAWNLQVGRTLGAVVAEADDRSKLSANVSTIESLLQNIPVTSNLQAVSQLREFVEFAKAEDISAERITEIRTRAEALANLRY